VSQARWCTSASSFSSSTATGKDTTNTIVVGASTKMDHVESPVLCTKAGVINFSFFMYIICNWQLLLYCTCNKGTNLKAAHWAN
jgi:hypothetical protein